MRQAIVVTSPWGCGLLKLSGGTFTVPMMAPNGTRFGGWLLNTADNRLGTGADYDGDGRAEILIQSPWGLGILELPYRPAATLVLVVDLVAAADVPRYPLEAVFAEVLGLQVPVVRLAAFDSSSPLKLLLALAAATR